MRPLLLVGLGLLVASCSSQEDELGVWIDVTPEGGGVLSAVFALDDSRVWVAGDSQCQPGDRCEGTRSAVFASADEGDSWTRALVPTANPQGFNLSAIYFFDRRDGLAVSFNVYESADGGRTWAEVVKLLGFIVRDVEFPEPTVGWAAANGLQGAVVLRTADRGQSWEPSSGSDRADVGDGFYTSISAPTPQTVYAVGRAVGGLPLFVRTADGGQAWEDVPPPAGDDGTIFYAVDFVDEAWGWVAGELRSVYRTADGGATWDRQDAGEGSDAIRDLHALDRNRAVAVTSAGAVLVTANGGATWEEQVPPDTGGEFGRAFYTASGVAYAAGNGRVLRARLF